MEEKVADKTAAQQTELAIRQLESLSITPSVAAACFSKLIEPQFSPASIAEIVESDPALTVRMFSLLHLQGINLAEEKLSFRQGIDRLAAQIVRDAIFSVKVAPLFAKDCGETSVLPKEDLIKHCLAVACCAKDIAEIVSPKMDGSVAYSAGLLHDIGKLALEEVMPKSFARIVEEAKQQQTHSCAIEQKYLGLDHTIIGKRLGQRWHLPNEIVLAVWLHHSETAAISQSMPEARLAQVVQLADLTARQCGIGQSGSYNSTDSAKQLMQSLGISSEQMEQICEELGEQVSEKCRIAGMDAAQPQAEYLKALHETAAQMTKRQTNLTDENQRLQTAASHLNFITDFLSGINSAALPIDIAEDFAVRWQKFYQTGMVCLYLAPSENAEIIDAVIVEKLSQSRVVSLKRLEDEPVIPQGLTRNFGILNAYEHIAWLFDQLDVDFDVRQTKLMPLRSGGKAVGAIAFELRYPSDVELFIENFKMATSVAGLAGFGDGGA